MSVYVENINGERYPIDISKIKDDMTKEELKRIIEDELDIQNFDISYQYPFVDGNVIYMSHLCDNISNAISEDHLDCIIKFYEENNFFPIDLSRGLSEKGHLKSLEFFQKNYLGWDDYTHLWAKEKGDSVCPDKTCKWNSWTCAEASRKNHTKCIKFAHENGCKWKIKRTHKDITRDGIYFFAAGCDWDEDSAEKSICLYATRKGDLECLEYAHKNGCKWDREECLKVSEGHPHIQEWIKNN